MRSVLLAALICLTLTLNGCSGSAKRMVSRDRAPTRHVNYQKIPDAVPKREKYHPYGTRAYTVRRRRYRVLKQTKGYKRRGYASWYGTAFHGRQTSTQDRYNLYGMSAASPELPLPCYAKVTNLANGKSVIVKVNDRGPFYGKRILDLSYAAARRLEFANQGVAYVEVEALGDHNWDFEHNSYRPACKHGLPTKGRPVVHTASSSTLSVAAASSSVVADASSYRTPTKAASAEKTPSTNRHNNSANSSTAMVKLQIASFKDVKNAKNCIAKIKKVLSAATASQLYIKQRPSGRYGQMYSVQLGPMPSTRSEQILAQLRQIGLQPLVLKMH